MPASGLPTVKLRAEIAQIQAETRKTNSDRSFLSQNGALLVGLLTALVAVGGFFLTLWKQISEQARQRDADREQRETENAQRATEREREREAREHEREQREADSLRRLEERFTAILGELGDKSDAVQAGAAVSLLTFVRPEQQAFHRQVRLVALANLKVQHPEPVRKLLLHVFEEAARLSPPEPNERDLSDAVLDGADLSGLDLSGANLSGASFVGANLENIVLREARGKGVNLMNARVCGKQADLHGIRLKELRAMNANFTEADLTAAHLEEADLRFGRFQQTRLQAAHLEGSDLSGAQFQDADLRDTYFTGKRDDRRKATVFDDKALRSILISANREHVHLSAEHEQRLAELAAGKSAAKAPPEPPA